MRRYRLLAALLCAATLASSCLKPDLAPRYTPAWEPFDPADAGWVKTKEVLLVSDCQLHNLNSKPVPERNLSAEAAVATAIRSPQLDMFSRDVLRWILENGAPEADVVVHLGDALDLACEGELEAFLDVMQAAQVPWFMAPGNHDCFYFGVYDPQHPELWQDACYGAGQPMRKDAFLRRYIAVLLTRPGPDGEALAAALGLTVRPEDTLVEVAERVPPRFRWERPI
jgi:hypothetical protein